MAPAAGEGTHRMSGRRQAALRVELGDGAFGPLVVGRLGGPPDRVPLGRVGGETTLTDRLREQGAHQSTTRRHCCDGVTLRTGSGSYSRWMMTRQAPGGTSIGACSSWMSWALDLVSR